MFPKRSQRRSLSRSARRRRPRLQSRKPPRRPRSSVRATALLALSALVAGAAAAQTWTGSISDSACGARHMIGMAARECAIACVKQGHAYVFVSQRQVYKLEDPAKIVPDHAGHDVSLTGEINAETITVAKIDMPARGRTR